MLLFVDAGPGDHSMLKTGDYVLIIHGEDDVSDGQICKVLAPDESETFHRYSATDCVPVLCWTGYLVWTHQQNLIEIAGDRARIRKLFQMGFSRNESHLVRF